MSDATSDEFLDAMHGIGDVITDIRETQIQHVEWTTSKLEELEAQLSDGLERLTELIENSPD